MSLRKRLIRLAHANPALRPDLLPLLKRADDVHSTDVSWLAAQLDADDARVLLMIDNGPVPVPDEDKERCQKLIDLHLVYPHMSEGRTEGYLTTAYGAAVARVVR